MSINVSQYLSQKTVKLTDTFVVRIEDSTDNGTYKKFLDTFGEEQQPTKVTYSDGTEVTTPATPDNDSNTINCIIPNCVDIKIPSLKTNTEQLKYNNYNKNFVHIDFDSAPDKLELTFFETSDNKINSWINYFLQVNGFNEINHGEYNPFNSISKITVYVLDNNLSKSVYAWVFKKCRMTGYDYNYSYDYQATDVPQVSIQFSFEEMYMGQDDSLEVNDGNLPNEHEREVKEAKEKKLRDETVERAKNSMNGYNPANGPRYSHGSGGYR